jgi:hypothetical protein
LTWQRLNLYAGDYSIYIEKLRRGQNDATRVHAAAAGRAVGEAGRPACVRAEPGMGKVLPYTNYWNLLPF